MSPSYDIGKIGIFLLLNETAQIHFGCRPDCAEIAHRHPGHLEAFQAGGGCTARSGGIQNARDGRVASISARMAAFAAWGPHAPLGTLAQLSLISGVGRQGIKKTY